MGTHVMRDVTSYKQANKQHLNAVARNAMLTTRQRYMPGCCGTSTMALLEVDIVDSCVLRVFGLDWTLKPFL